MSRGLKIVGCIAVLAVLLMAVPSAWAHPELARKAKAPCSGCHVDAFGGAALSEAGKAYKASGKAPAAGAQSPEYVGSSKCKMCHMAQYKAWATTKHAAAFANLEKADPKVAADFATKLKVDIKAGAAKTDGCVSCHVTGYQLAGGYPGADAAKTAAVAGVTCEACHGPGGKHVAAPKAEKKGTIAVAPGAGTCKGCHTPAMSPAFDFAKAKGKVHPTPAAG
jgi:hypothetical protein